MKKLLFVAGMAVVSSAAFSATVVFNLNSLYTGTTPSGTAPWVTITIADIAANKVNVKIDHNATSVAGQFVSNVYLNMDPFVSGITISNEVNANKRNGFGTALNGVNGAAGHNFDMEINFQTSNSGGGIDRLKPGEFWSGDLTGTGLAANNFLSVDNFGMFAGAQVQGIPGNQSGHIAAVPEPATMFGLAMGVAAIAARRRKK